MPRLHLITAAKHSTARKHNYRNNFCTTHLDISSEKVTITRRMESSVSGCQDELNPTAFEEARSLSRDLGQDPPTIGKHRNSINSDAHSNTITKPCGCENP
jgi:hypothetical protein